jgi:serine/threonine protein kinase
MSLILKNGTILNGKYEIIDKLGQGGFAIAYKAKNIQNSKFVVIKEFIPYGCSLRRKSDNSIHVGTQRDAFYDGLDRFRREARNLSLFHHPNIVPIIDYFDDNNTGYYVMKFKKGKTFNEMYQNELLSQDEIIDVVFPILEGLKEMHSKNMYHRDIKPENIFMVEGGMPILIDFGAARMAMINKSQEFTRILTHGYAPPEQYESSAKNQGPWTDIYAISAWIYEMITGKKPNNAIDRVTDRKPLKFTIKDSRKFDKEFLSIVRKALSIETEDRPQSVSEFQDIIMDAIEKNNNSFIINFIKNFYKKILKRE